MFAVGKDALLVFLKYKTTQGYHFFLVFDCWA